jgi:hypothetical protein
MRAARPVVTCFLCVIRTFLYAGFVSFRNIFNSALFLHHNTFYIVETFGMRQESLSWLHPGSSPRNGARLWYLAQSLLHRMGMDWPEEVKDRFVRKSEPDKIRVPQKAHTSLQACYGY